MGRLRLNITSRETPARHVSVFAVFLLALLLLPGTVGSAPVRSDGKKPLIEGADTRARRFQKLRDQAREQGSARVILHLDTPFALEGHLGARGDVVDQRRRIADHQDRLLQTLEGTPFHQVKKFHYIPFMALEVGEETLARLENDPRVIDIEEDTRSAPAAADTVQWVGADKAWDYGYTGAGWTVAVLDTGVEVTHPYFQGRIVGGACFSNMCGSPAGVNCSPSAFGSICNHGTYIAGIIASNSGGVERNGVGKGASIMPIQIFSSVGETSIDSSKSDQILALQYVYSLKDTYKIAAVNISVHGELHASQASCDAANPSAKTMFDLLRSAGIAPVIPSGNDGTANTLAYPACLSSAVSVGGTYGEDRIASFSDSAGFLSLLAPGVGVCSTTFWSWGGWTCEYAGTSLAAPHVSGAWALLKQAVPSATVDQILSALQETGVPVTDPRNGLTKSRIRVDAALSTLTAKPRTRMAVLPSVSSPSFMLSWSETAARPSPVYFDVQVRDGYKTDCTPDCAWTNLLTDTTQTSMTFTGLHGHTYFFRIRARDGLGNQETYGYEEWGQTFTTVLTGPAPVLTTSVKSGSPALFAPGQDLNYTITLRNTGNQTAAAAIEDAPPATLTVDPLSLRASAGSAPVYAAGVITWTGTVPIGGEVYLTYKASPDPDQIQFYDVVTNTVRISGSVRGDLTRSAAVTKAYGLWLPLLHHSAP